MKMRAIPVLLAFIALATSQAAPELASSSEIGTVSMVDNAGVIGFVPWGKTSTEVKAVGTGSETSASVATVTARMTDLKAGMWIIESRIIG